MELRRLVFTPGSSWQLGAVAWSAYRAAKIAANQRCKACLMQIRLLALKAEVRLLPALCSLLPALCLSALCSLLPAPCSWCPVVYVVGRDAGCSNNMKKLVFPNL